ncbi:MAG: pyridoxamine 5'-phosphate oxidase [Nitrospiria bacterium]
MDISYLRKEHCQNGLKKANLDQDPFKQFETWFTEACDSKMDYPNAMSLSTASKSGEPTLRTVLLKIFDSRGFVFFTNYESEKAKQIEENRHVALLFPWLSLDRQVKILGTATKIPTAESLKYFMTRPRGSQLGAWVSHQSQVISTRKILETSFKVFTKRFSEGSIPIPNFWGGYRIVPRLFEFWQGRPDRLHDRFVYRPQSDTSWRIERLAP